MPREQCRPSVRAQPVQGPARCGRDAPGHTSPDDRARSCRRRLADHRLVLALHGRIRDLEDVEHPHGDVVLDVGEGPGHADEPDLALASQRHQLAHRVVLLQGGPGGAGVELHHVEVVRAHPPQALLHSRPHVRPREHVLAESAGPTVGVHGAAALAGQEELVTAVRDVLPDQLLRAAVVGRGIDEGDAGVEDLVEESARLGGVEVTAQAAARSSQLHGAVAQLAHGEAGAAQGVRGEARHVEMLDPLTRLRSGPMRCSQAAWRAA